MGVHIENQYGESMLSRCLDTFLTTEKTLLLIIKIVLEIISRGKKDTLYSFTPSFKIFPTLIFVQTSHNLSARLKLLNLICK